MTEPAQPQPADPPVPDDSVQAGQPVTIEPVDSSAGTANATPGPATSAAPAQDGPPPSDTEGSEPGTQPASPAETQASGTDTDPVSDTDAEPGPGGAGAQPVVPGSPAEVVDLGGAHIATQLKTGGATSNESPSLPPNIQSSGAKVHAGLDLLLKVAKDDGESAEDKLPQVVAIAEALHADLDRYVPESIRQVALADVEKMLRHLHL